MIIIILILLRVYSWRKQIFALLPLAIFVAGHVQAEEKLDVINVVSENSGAKSKTNVITTKTMERSTETELKGLLKEWTSN